MPGVYPPLDGSEWVNGDPERVIRIVLYGLKGDVHVEGHLFNAAAMPVFGQVAQSAYNWNDEKVAAVLTYVRQAWGNKSGRSPRTRLRPSTKPWETARRCPSRTSRRSSNSAPEGCWLTVCYSRQWRVSLPQRIILIESHRSERTRCGLE